IQSAILIIAHVQCAKRRARAAGISETADDKLLCVLALDLEPVGSPSRFVWALCALGDNAFQSKPARLSKHFAAAADDVFVVSNLLVFTEKKRCHKFFALDKRRGGEVVSAAVQNIEDEINEVVIAGLEGILQGLEVRDPFLVQSHDLTVENRV